jgi:hypothetical protein
MRIPEAVEAIFKKLREIKADLEIRKSICSFIVYC